MLQALRIRDFRLLWAGGLISGLGSWLLVLAIPAHVFQATGSLRDTGLTLAAEYLPPLVLGPVAAMLLGTAPGRYWVLYVALIAESGGGVLYAPAAQARTPAIVGTGPVLTGANALSSATDGTVRLIGGPLGGILLTRFGITWLICADALSYAVSAGANLLTSRSTGRIITTGPLRRGLADGMRALRHEPGARALLPVMIGFTAANASLSAVLIPFAVGRLGGSVNAGYLLSCLGIGFLLAAPALRALLDRTEPRTLLTVTLTAWSGAVFVMFTSSALAIALPAAAAIGMSGTMSLVTTQTVLQRVIPDAVLGRVSAVFLTAEAAATLAGAITGPLLAQAANLTALAAVASLVTLAAAGLASGRVTLRR